MEVENGRAVVEGEVWGRPWLSIVAQFCILIVIVFAHIGTCGNISKSYSVKNEDSGEVLMSFIVEWIVLHQYQQLLSFDNVLWTCKVLLLEELGGGYTVSLYCFGHFLLSLEWFLTEVKKGLPGNYIESTLKEVRAARRPPTWGMMVAGAGMGLVVELLPVPPGLCKGAAFRIARLPSIFAVISGSSLLPFADPSQYECSCPWWCHHFLPYCARIAWAFPGAWLLSSELYFLCSSTCPILSALDCSPREVDCILLLPLPLSWEASNSLSTSMEKSSLGYIFQWGSSSLSSFQDTFPSKRRKETLCVKALSFLLILCYGRYPLLGLW